MLRWRNPGAREVLMAYLALYAVAVMLLNLLPGLEPGKASSAHTLIVIFLVWRVYRGGGISHAFLLIGAVLSYASPVLAVARYWNPLVVALAAIAVLQLLLLVSPPVRARLQREIEVTSWAAIAAGLRRPPAWLLIGGVLAGVLITLAFLGNVSWVPVPGCAPATSSACTALAEGYPLHWLTAVQNTPWIYKAALVKDCTQWTLVSWSVLYVLWNRHAAASQARVTFPALGQE